ncbi:MAG: hypothetical protein P8Y78_02405 [Acidihalobacter sp.]|jgi:hypothetical protein
MQEPNKRQLAPRAVRNLFRTILLTGLLLPAGLGVMIRTILQIQGVGVVGLAEGAAGVLPLTLFFLPPYFLLALLIRRVLLGMHARGEMPLRRWWYISVGAYAGMTLVCMFLLSSILPDYEAITMVVFMWPLTFPYVLVLELGGVLAGGVLGWIAGWIRSSL